MKRGFLHSIIKHNESLKYKSNPIPKVLYYDFYKPDGENIRVGDKFGSFMNFYTFEVIYIHKNGGRLKATQDYQKHELNIRNMQIYLV